MTRRIVADVGMTYFVMSQLSIFPFGAIFVSGDLLEPVGVLKGKSQMQARVFGTPARTRPRSK